MNCMIIYITKFDIKFGKRASSYRCLVARTFSRKIQDWQRCYVFLNTIKIFSHRYPYEIIHTIEIPPLIKEFIKRFDANEAVEPTSFEVDVPEVN